MQVIFEWMCGSLVALAIVIAIILCFIPAPYGRFSRRGWGPFISSTVGWVTMESAAVLTILFMFVFSQRRTDFTAVLFLVIWQSHYLYRTFVFPFRRRGKNRPMPLVVMLMAIFFNVWNGYLNGAWLFYLGPVREVDWLLTAPFWCGAALFVVGMFINHQSDNILRKLRGAGEEGYQIPYGGLYRWVSMPSYLGELLEWCGFALLTWSPAAVVFAIFTAANLIPRAISSHRWYQQTFKNYPRERKAVIPYFL